MRLKEVRRWLGMQGRAFSLSQDFDYLTRSRANFGSCRQLRHSVLANWLSALDFPRSRALQPHYRGEQATLLAPFRQDPAGLLTRLFLFSRFLHLR